MFDYSNGVRDFDIFGIFVDERDDAEGFYLGVIALDSVPVCASVDVVLPTHFADAGKCMTEWVLDGRGFFCRGSQIAL